MVRTWSSRTSRLIAATVAATIVGLTKCRSKSLVWIQRRRRHTSWSQQRRKVVHTARGATPCPSAASRGRHQLAEPPPSTEGYRGARRRDSNSEPPEPVHHGRDIRACEEEVLHLLTWSTFYFPQVCACCCMRFTVHALLRWDLEAPQFVNMRTGFQQLCV